MKIGAHLIQLEWVERVNDNDDSGEYDEQEGTIKLKRNLPDSLRFSSFIHEVMHPMNSTIDHALLDSLAEQLAQVLWDNDLVNKDKFNS